MWKQFRERVTGGSGVSVGKKKGQGNLGKIKGRRHRYGGCCSKEKGSFGVGIRDFERGESCCGTAIERGENEIVRKEKDGREKSGRTH